jgi:thiamine monophosphate kinase
VFKVGDIVTWYDYYGCGTICRDSGVGLIIQEDVITGHNVYSVLKRNYSTGQYTDRELEDYAIFSKRQNEFAKANY